MTEYRKLLFAYDSELFSLAVEGYESVWKNHSGEIWERKLQHRRNKNIIHLFLDFPKRKITLIKNGKLKKEIYG